MSKQNVLGFLTLTILVLLDVVVSLEIGAVFWRPLPILLFPLGLFLITLVLHTRLSKLSEKDFVLFFIFSIMVVSFFSLDILNRHIAYMAQLQRDFDALFMTS